MIYFKMYAPDSVSRSGKFRNGREPIPGVTCGKYAPRVVEINVSIRPYERDENDTSPISDDPTFSVWAFGAPLGPICLYCETEDEAEKRARSLLAEYGLVDSYDLALKSAIESAQNRQNKWKARKAKRVAARGEV